jgi:hypothetical protein
LLIDPLDLATQPASYLTPNVDELDFLPGKSAYTFEQDRLSATLTSDTSTDNDAGDFFTWRLQARVRNVRLTVESLRIKLLNRRVHVVATYSDGLQQIVPYMRLAASSQSGQRWRDANAYQFRGEARTLVPATSINATLDPGSGGGGGGGSNSTTMQFTTSSSTYTVNVPAGYLLKSIAVNTSSAETISLGTTPGGNDLLDGIPIFPPAGSGWPVVGENILYTPTSQNIYFSGLSGTNTIILFFEVHE